MVKMRRRIRRTGAIDVVVGIAEGLADRCSTFLCLLGIWAYLVWDE
jgi:hypothetical protein